MLKRDNDGGIEITDVVIVGAGPAGLSAALVLGRMRRAVLVVDTDAPAHAVSDGVHGFLAQDGTPPMHLRAIGRAQLKPYGTVETRQVAALMARQSEGEGFEVELLGGTAVQTRKLLLAHGMRYELPDVEGLAPSWGKTVFHCPYCHGWEVRDQTVAVYGCSDRAVHQALLLASLAEDIVLLCEQTAGLSSEKAADLASAGIRVESRPVRRVAVGDNGLNIALDGTSDLVRTALFVQPTLILASDLAVSLGALLTDMGTVATDATGLSTVPGLYVAGDAATPVQSVAIASASGARAAYAINAELASLLAPS